jgi:hypothetical protein
MNIQLILLVGRHLDVILNAPHYYRITEVMKNSSNSISTKVITFYFIFFLRQTNEILLLLLLFYVKH